MSHPRLSELVVSRWAMLLVVVVFICLKIPHLSYPFYCDEGWVYAPAVKHMAINGPSLLPGVIRSDYSRGHPLLFHFLCGWWIRLFGSSNVSLHSFPLLISVGLLVALYEGCSRLFNRRTAMIVLLLTVTQTIFFVQSSMVELEVMTALLAFLSLYFYVKDQSVAATISLSLLFLTKESGVVFGVVIGCHALLRVFQDKGHLRRNPGRLLVVVIPALLLAVFFLIQKAREGWFLLPLHSSLIHSGWDAFYKLFCSCIHFTFDADESVHILFIGIVCLGVLPAILKRNARYLFLLPLAISIYILNNKAIIEHTGDIPWIALFAVSITLATRLLLGLRTDLGQQARLFLLLLVFSVVAYLCFSSISVMTYRYLLVVVVLALVFCAVALDSFIAALGDKLFFISLILIAISANNAYWHDGGTDDTDLEAYHAMDVQLGVARFLEKDNAYDKEVAWGSFWELAQLVDTMQGFRNTPRPFTRINWDTATATTDYAIFDNICPRLNYERVKANSNYSLVFTVRSGHSWAEVYRKKKVSQQ